MFSSPLQRAIARGMKPGGDLAAELGTLDDYVVRSRKDARAICDALAKLQLPPPPRPSMRSPLHALAALFQDVEGADAPAFEVLSKDGLPQLVRIFDAKIDTADEDADDLLFVLKVLAMYGSDEGAQRVIQAARKPLKPENYMWEPVLSCFSPAHPHRDEVFEALGDPLPPGFIAVALFDSANRSALEVGLARHPFDSPAGWQRLQRWVEDCDADHFSYAHSATAALPFLSNPPRDNLLALAMDHADPGVQMEAAWAAAKLGREGGLKLLARYCLDVNHSDGAQHYLTELGRPDLVPAEATEPSFQAKAEFARWLAHPSELGRPPDELEIVDHRTLAWPPEREPTPFWVIRYLVRDTTGLDDDDVDCGLVGSATWCFFSHKMHQRPPEDVYAIHCFWEMQQAGLIDEADATDASEYAGLLNQWRGAPLTDPKVELVAELSPKLKAPSRLVALASARIGGDEGWVALDGPRSTWYPAADQPKGTYGSDVLMIHVGRQLLGFGEHPDRAKYLVAGRPRREPRAVLAAYERHLADAAGGPAKRLTQLLGSGGLLSRHFEAYVAARVAETGDLKPRVVIDVYARLVELARRADDSIREDVFSGLGALGEHFEPYVDALVSQGRSGEVPQWIEFMEPHWEHNLGYRRLGAAAFKAGRWEIAERFLVKLRDELEGYYSSEEMSFLAEIWHRRGEAERARELLIGCLQKLATEIGRSKYNSSRESFAEVFRLHRATYLRLFPGGEVELAKLNIPVEPV